MKVWRVRKSMPMLIVLGLMWAGAAGAAIEAPGHRETIEADVSSRSVAVTTSFIGSEIIVFGTINNSRQPSAESGYYDVVVVVEGTHTPLVARRKSNVGGIWVNSASVRFSSLPSYYAIASTRPIDEIAEADVLFSHDIGFEHVPMRPTATPRLSTMTDREIRDFQQAIVRLKQKDRLFVRADYGVVFTGRSLFRSTIRLPANVPLGELVARVLLFRNGEVLSSYSSRVNLGREGVERYLYDFAHRYPFWYGLSAVALAVIAGLAASFLFKRGAH